MTIQGSGTPITLGQIRTELGHSGSIGLRAAEIGTYGPLNTNSTSRPDGTTPSLMSEWYGYDHAAGGGPTLYTHSLKYSGVTKSAACSASPATYYSDCSTLANGCYIYSDNNLPSPTAGFNGWYAVGPSNDDTVYASDGAQIYNISTCGAV